MYSQMANVAENVARMQEGPQLTEAMQQQNVVRKNKEQAEKVQQASGDGSKTSVVKDEGRNGADGTPADKGRKKNNEKEEQEDTPQNDGIRESYLGQHINITR